MSDVNESSRIKVPGCGCKAGACATNHCSCRRLGIKCSAILCKCCSSEGRGCVNLPTCSCQQGCLGGGCECRKAGAPCDEKLCGCSPQCGNRERTRLLSLANSRDKKVSSKNESNSAPSAPTSITFNFHQHVTHNHHQYNDNRQVHNTIHILAIPGSFVFGANPQKPMIAANGGSGGLQLLSQEESQQFIVESQNARRGSHPEPIDPRQLSMAFLTAFSEIMNQLGDPNAQEALEQLFDPNVEAEFAGQYVQGSQAVKQFFLSTGQSRWVFDETNMQAHYNGQAYILQVSCQLTSATLNETKVVGLIAQLVEVAPKHVVINRVAVTG